MPRLILTMLMLVPLCACLGPDRQLEIELRRSLKNYVASVNERHLEGLHISVYFPGVNDYKAHVQKLLFDYLEQTRRREPITFDDQGVVLTRFLGMTYYNYQVKHIEKVDDRNVVMRIGYTFSFDANLKQANYEKGTKVYIPAQPWGTTYEIVVGEPAPAPRNQLRYAEVVVEMRRTNHEGYWQVRTCKVDPGSIDFETSYETEFYRGE